MYCSNFFRARCLFSSGVAPSVWTVGQVLPAHASDVLRSTHWDLMLSQWKGGRQSTKQLQDTVETLITWLGGSKFFNMSLFISFG